MSEAQPPEQPPQILGGAGLTGRQDPSFGHPAMIRDAPELEEVPEGGSRQTMPTSCLRQMTIPARGNAAGCASQWGTCPGQQRDGGCLIDIVKAAKAAGVHWAFEVDPHDGFWDYSGDPIPGLVTERRDYGQVYTRWEPGYEPASPIPEPVIPTFDCPHCGTHNTQDPSNFHFWCSACGKNANE